MSDCCQGCGVHFGSAEIATAKLCVACHQEDQAVTAIMRDIARGLRDREVQQGRDASEAPDPGAVQYLTAKAQALGLAALAVEREIETRATDDQPRRCRHGYDGHVCSVCRVE